MQSACAVETFCPTLTTCVENDLLFEKEMKTLRGTLPITSTYGQALDGADSILKSDQWTDHTENPNFFDAAFKYKFPKVLLSEKRAEALLRTSTWEFGKEIFRPVPGHTRVRLRQVGAGEAAPTTVAVSLVSSQDWWSTEQL